MDAAEPGKAGGYRPRYSGMSHMMLTFIPPAIGYIASIMFVFLGPFAWWANWLIVGAAWGITKPVRMLVRSALVYTTHEFRSAEYSWWVCVKEEALNELASWRRDPWHNMSTVLMITVLDTFLWPALVPLGAVVGNQLDHG